MGNSNRTQYEKFMVQNETQAIAQSIGVAIVAGTLAYVSYQVHKMRDLKIPIWEFTGVFAILILLLLWLVSSVAYYVRYYVYFYSFSDEKNERVYWTQAWHVELPLLINVVFCT